MASLLGVSAASILIGLLLAVVAILVWVVLLAWRAPLLVRLGLRNVPRRRTRAALIVLGLMLSTTVAGSALGTGDAMRYTVRSVVTESLGTVDEVVVANPPQRDLGNQLRSLTQPGIASLAASGLSYFPAEQVEHLNAATEGHDQIAALSPAIADQVSIINPAQQQLTSSAFLLALPTTIPGAFGTLTADDNPLDLAGLGADQIVVNAAAADSLSLQAGTELRMLPPDGAWSGKAIDEPWVVQVAAVVDNGGILGNQPALVVPLPRYQQMIGQLGMINQVLVVNKGGVASVDRTDPALEALRGLLINRDAARQLHDLLAAPSSQQGLADAASVVDQRFRNEIATLRGEAAKPEVSDRFVSIVTDPQMRIALYQLARAGLRGEQQRTAFRLVRTITDLSVLPVKQQGVDQANDYGQVVTTVFLVLGVFSFAASLLLIFLTFSLLAADRSAELATMRAMGMRNRQVMGVFLVEGLVYNVIGALLGMLAGVVAAWLTTVSLGRALEPFGLTLRPHVELRTTLISFAVGVLLTFCAMLISAWRVSRTGIVAATRGEDASDRQRWLLILGALLMLAGVAFWRHWQQPPYPWLPRHPLVLPGALTLGIAGLWCVAAGALNRRQRTSEAVVLLASGAIAVVWLRALTGVPTPHADLLDDTLTVAIGGVLLLLSVTWVVVRGLGPLLRLLDWLLSPLGRIRATVRPAAAQVGWQRWRTALVVVMFGIVVFIMASSLSLIASLLHAYGIDDAPVAGFELRADLAGAPRIPDLRAALTDAESVSPQSFSAIGGLRTIDTQMIAVGDPDARWQGTTLAAVDDDFLTAAQVHMQRSANGSDSDADTWRTLRDHPGTAVMTTSMLQATMLDSSSANTTLPPLTIWLRPGDSTATTGAPIKLTVIGIIDSRADLPTGIYTSTTSAAGLGVGLPDPDAWFLAVQSGVSLDDAAQGLKVAFADQGLIVTDLGDTLRVSQSLRTLLTRIVQGFMGLGLIAGVAALGLLGIQGVIERRRELGTLRALGFTRRQTGSTLAIESAAVAALGILLGVTLGLFLARTLITLLAARWPELTFTIPWSQIALTAGLACLGSAFAITLAAWQASRVSPAEALRG
jgi:putative ABC transport system permease protein